MVSPAKPAGGQAKVDSTRKGWDIEELLIAIYYTVSGFVWKTVSEIILVKTGNASIESYHVHEEVGRRIDVHEKLYNKIDDIYHLKEIGKAMLSFMKQRNVDENERTAMWEWITVLKPEEEEIVRNDGQNMVQRQCYEKQMSPKEVREELNKGFYGKKG